MSIASPVPRARKIPEWKIREVEELAELIKKYGVIGIADLSKIPTRQLQILRKKLRKRIVFRVTKNTLFKLAAKKAGLKNFEELSKHLEGMNLFLFTNMNPFELVLLLDKNAISAPAKPGDIAPKEIVIPSGSTGIPPGPMLSVFGRLKIPTRVQEGVIWIAKDTVVAKPGDKISPELASILNKLGIEPMEVKLTLKAVYDHGLIITKEKLSINLDEYKEMVSTAFTDAIKLGIEIAYPEPMVLKYTLMKAYINTLALAVEASIVTPETINFIISKAEIVAKSLAAILAEKAPELELQVEKPSEEKEEKKKEEKKEEEKKEEAEEEIAAGLSALFG